MNRRVLPREDIPISNVDYGGDSMGYFPSNKISHMTQMSQSLSLVYIYIYVRQRKENILYIPCEQSLTICDRFSSSVLILWLWLDEGNAKHTTIDFGRDSDHRCR